MRIFYLLVFCLPFLCLQAQTRVQPMLYSTNESVVGTIETDSFIYMAGPTTWYTPQSYVALFDTASRKLLAQPFKSDGYIDNLIEDGKGGFFITGGFDSINGLYMPRLAHLKSDFSLDAAWNFPLDQFIPNQKISDIKIIGGDTINVANSDEIYCINGHLHLLRQCRWTSYESYEDYSDHKETSLWRFDNQSRQWQFLRHFPFGAQWLHQAQTGVYLYSSYLPSSALSSAPRRDSVFYYDMNKKDVSLLFRLKLPRETEIKPLFIEGKIHLIGERNYENAAFVWHCFDIATNAMDTALERKIQAQLMPLLGAMEQDYETEKLIFSLSNSLYVESVEPLTISIERDTTFYCLWLPDEQRFLCNDTLSYAPEIEESTDFTGGLVQDYLYNGNRKTMVNTKGQLLMVGYFSGVAGREASLLQRFYKNSLELDTLWNPDINGSIYRCEFVNNHLFLDGDFVDEEGYYPPGLLCFTDLDQAQPRRIDNINIDFSDLDRLSIHRGKGNTLFVNTSKEYDLDDKAKREKIYQLQIEENDINAVQEIAFSNYIEDFFQVENGLLASYWGNASRSLKYCKNLKSIGKKGKVLLKNWELYKIWQHGDYLYWVSYDEDNIQRMHGSTFKIDKLELQVDINNHQFDEYFFEREGDVDNYSPNFSLIRYDFDKQEKTTVFSGVGDNIYINKVDNNPNIFFVEGDGLTIEGVKIPTQMAIIRVQ